MLLNKLAFKSCCCCISLESGCTAIGAFEWMFTVYLSCRFYDMQKVGCGLKLSCSQIYYNVLSFLVSAAVVSGINKKSREYFIPWLIVKFIEYTTFTSMMIYDLTNRFLPDTDLILPLSFTLVSIFIFYYSWLCVLSLYINMVELNSGDQDDSQLQELV